MSSQATCFLKRHQELLQSESTPQTLEGLHSSVAKLSADVTDIRAGLHDIETQLSEMRTLMHSCFTAIMTHMGLQPPPPLVATSLHSVAASEPNIRNSSSWKRPKTMEDKGARVDQPELGGDDNLYLEAEKVLQHGGLTG